MLAPPLYFKYSPVIYNYISVLLFDYYYCVRILLLLYLPCLESASLQKPVGPKICLTDIYIRILGCTQSL